MRQQHIAIFSLAGLIYAAPARGASLDHAASLPERVADFVEASLAAGYTIAPALMLGLATLLVVPALAFIGSRLRRRAALRPANAPVPVEGGVVPASRRHACLEGTADKRDTFVLLHEMLRIGREEDNDIRLTARNAHRYHAVVHREAPGCYLITDMSGLSGNGVRVNGERCACAELADGDVIELGERRLTFRAGLI